MDGGFRLCKHTSLGHVFLIVRVDQRPQRYPQRCQHRIVIGLCVQGAIIGTGLIGIFDLGDIKLRQFLPVSYTHLDVYKRQVLVRQTCATSGVSGIALTKLDVLDGFKTLKICVGYDLDGVRLDYLPTAADQQARCTPIYEEMEGWSETTAGARSWAQLPGAAIKYVRRIEELIQCPVALLSTSPEREDTILVTDPFAD